MYDTEKRVELVKNGCMKNIAGRSAAGSAGCLPCARHCLRSLWERCTLQPARRRSPPGECTVLSCCMKTPAVMCWWG